MRAANAIFGAFLLASTAAHADGACKPPAWAPTPPPGYKLNSCVVKAWDSVSYELPGGPKVVEGERTDVDYELVDESKNLTNAKARDYFAAAGQKAGGTLKSEKNGGWTAILEHKTPQADEWWSYTHGSGNDESTGSFTLRTVVVRPLVQEVKVKVADVPWDTQAKDCKDPPWLVSQFSTFKRDSCNAHDLDSFEFETKDGTKRIAGHLFDVTYTATDDAKTPIPSAVWKNYVTALQGIGAKLVSDPNVATRAVLTQKTAHGDVWYMYEQAGGNEESVGGYRLLTVTPGGLPPKQCKVELYGVNFDTDKADIRPDSAPVLDQVLALFKADPKLAGEISGHTDDVGDAAYNKKLSGQRADAVKAWLGAHGVDGGRLTTAGYGATKPIVPNTSDANRAKNRRVELTRKNCQ